jgi:hypothetical protein
MYGVMSPLNLGSTWMLTLGKEIVATYITKTLVANCNKSSIFDFFFQGIRSKPKHRVLILVGLFLMWTFHFNFEFNFSFFHLLLQFISCISYFCLWGSWKVFWRKAFENGKMCTKLEKTIGEEQHKLQLLFWFYLHFFQILSMSFF